MFAKLTKPTLRHSKAEIRLAAIHEIDAGIPEQQTMLADLVNNDPDQAVQLAAIGKLLDTDLLINLATDGHSELSQTARNRLAEILTGKTTTAVMTETERLAILKPVSHFETLIYLADHGDEAIRQAIIDRFDAEEDLERVLTASAVAKIRLEAARKIHDPERLQRIAKFSRHKDNGIYQYAQQRLGEIRNAEAHITQQIARGLSLCEDMETLAAVAFIPAGYPARIKQIESAWTELEIEPSAEVKERFQIAGEKCAARQKVYEAEHAKQVCSERLESLLQALMAASAPEESDAEKIDETLRLTDEEWRALNELAAANTEEQARFEQVRRKLLDYRAALKRFSEHETAIRDLCEKLAGDNAKNISVARKQLQQAIQKIRWPLAFNRPTVLVETDAVFARLDEKQKTLDTQLKQRIETLQTLIQQLTEAVDNGNVLDAKELLDKAQSQTDTLPANEGRPFKSKLVPLRARTQELSGWRKFAENQQRKTLCERMEELAAKSVDPQHKVNAIKQLQTEWKALDKFEAAPASLWRRFHKASDAAYAPCKQHFETQAKLRETNLAERTRLCTELKNYIDGIDWDTVDWRGLDKKLRHALDKWRQYSPVDRKPGKTLDSEFNEYVTLLKSRLKDEQQKNLETKRTLIANAEALTEQTDTQEAIRKIKELQNTWRDCGITAQRQEQVLWKKFRSACDVVYERVKENRNTEQATLTQNKIKAEEICTQIEVLAKSSDTEPAVAQKKYQELRESFRQIGALPEKPAIAIRKRFTAACKLYESQLKTRNSRKHQSMQNEWLRKIALCQQIETAGNNGATPDSIIGEWESTIELPKAAREKTETRFASAKAAMENGGHVDGFNRDLERAQILCIRAEILANLESPAEVREQRMAYQISNLREAMTGGLDNHKPGRELAAELLTEWSDIGPIDRDQFGALEARLRKVLSVLK
jgi:hypothetical protein